MNNNYLTHYGILGMRWGVKKGSLKSVNKNKSKFDTSKKNNGKKIAVGILATAGVVGVAATIARLNKSLKNGSFIDGRPSKLQAILAAPIMIKELV